MPAVVDVHGHTRILEHVAVHAAEERRVVQYVARQVGDLDPLYGRMHRGRCRRIAHTEADHEHALRVVTHEQRHMRERAHVALREGPRRRHRVPVGHEPPSLARRLGDRDDFVDALALIEHVFVRIRLRKRTGSDVVARKRQPHGKCDGDDNH